jgi:REP element-mobilizing transposase RayT
MARALRVAFEDAVYHLCARGNRRERIFIAEKDYAQFEQLLAESLTRYQIELHSYVLLQNHFHLLARTLRPNVSRWMHWLITNYSVWFNRRHQLSGHVFQGRYKGFLVQEGNYLLEVSRYLHLNPVRGRALNGCDPGKRRTQLRAYKWSSYRGYAGMARQKDFVTEDVVLGEFGDGRGRRRTKILYRQFVEEGIVREIESPFEQVRWEGVLGDESFARRLYDRFALNKDQSREVTGLRHSLGPTEPTDLIDRVARHYRITRQELLGERLYGFEAPSIAMWLLRQRGALTLREIGQLFGGLDYAAVSQRIRRVNQEIAKGKRLRRICEMLNV